MSNELFGNRAGWTTYDHRALGRPRAMRPLMVRFLPGLLFAYALAGCGGGENTGSRSAALPPPAALPRPAAEGWHGHFIGTVTIGDRARYGDALLTVDGLIRLYIGGPYVSDGTVDQSKPESSAQFTGSIEVDGDQATGSGVIIGQGCAVPDTAGFCGETAFAEVRIAFAGPGLESGEIAGEIQVRTNDGDETWSLELTSWSNFYTLPATLGSVAGQYQEELAEFAQDDVLINVDSGGQLFFQSAHSGCTGNGSVAPHLDGEFNVYDVTLTIDGCDATYAHLIGEYDGLATQSPGAYWDYDSWLRIWLSTRDGTPSQAGVTTWGRLL